MSDKGTFPDVVGGETAVVAAATVAGTVEGVAPFPVGPLFSVHIAEKKTEIKRRLVTVLAVFLSILFSLKYFPRDYIYINLPSRVQCREVCTDLSFSLILFNSNQRKILRE
jgi:hypothetical protein